MIVEASEDGDGRSGAMTTANVGAGTTVSRSSRPSGHSMSTVTLLTMIA